MVTPAGISSTLEYSLALPAWQRESWMGPSPRPLPICGGLSVYTTCSVEIGASRMPVPGGEANTRDEGVTMSEG